MRIKSISELPQRYQAQSLPPAPATGKPAKYRNQPVFVDEQRFDSKLEARCYEELKLRQAAGEVRWFVRQVNFRLEGGVRYRADFVVMLMAGGCEVIDAKGVLTESSGNKIKQMKARYGIEVILWKGEK